MRVKCPNCGHEFEPYTGPVAGVEIFIQEYPFIPAAGDTADMSRWLAEEGRVILYRHYLMDCGHVISVEFTQFKEGDQTCCSVCKKETKIVREVK